MGKSDSCGSCSSHCIAARSMLENKHEESKIDKQTAGKTIRETSYAETVPEDDPILNVFKKCLSDSGSITCL